MFRRTFLKGVAGMPFGTSRAQGFNDQIVSAFQAGNVVINKSGMFAYSSFPPAFGNLAASIVTVASVTSDGKGNAVLPGITSYANAVTTGKIAANMNTGQFSISWSSGGAGGPYLLQSQWLLVGSGQNPELVADNHLSLILAAVSPGEIVVQLGNFRLQPGIIGTASDPTIGGFGGDESWHNFTLDAGWTQPVLSRPRPQYRLSLDQRRLELRGAASAVAGAGGKTLNSGTPLVAPYIPAQPSDFYSSDAVGNRMHIGIGNTGIITATFPAGAAGTWFAEIQGEIPLD